MFYIHFRNEIIYTQLATTKLHNYNCGYYNIIDYIIDVKIKVKIIDVSPTMTWGVFRGQNVSPESPQFTRTSGRRLSSISRDVVYCKDALRYGQGHCIREVIKKRGEMKLILINIPKIIPFDTYFYFYIFNQINIVSLPSMA